MRKMKLFNILLGSYYFCQVAYGFNLNNGSTRRREWLTNEVQTVASLLLPNLIFPQGCGAVSNEKPEEFKNVGTQAPPPSEESPFVTLPSGVKIKDFRVGQGVDSVQKDSSQVQIQCSGRLLNLNGVIFYNTKNNIDKNDGFGGVAQPLVFGMGKNIALPGLEEGIVGMKKGGIRRIIVPAELAYSKYPDLEPQPTTTLDQRALDSVIKNPRRDATILFDVSLERFK